MKPLKPDKAKLVISIFTGAPVLFKEALSLLEGEYGAADFLSEEVYFSGADYYKDEFGTGLVRKIVSFERPVDMEGLPDIKLFTNGVEDRSSSKTGRRINIDPGYLTLERFVLATCKNFTHRIYLGKGVFADLTLIFGGSEFRALEWTYPDYRTDEIRSLMKEIRKRYAFAIGRGLRNG